MERAREHRGSGSVIPLIQAALCALILLALVALKFTNGEVYGKTAEWYRREASREIELPGRSAPHETAASGTAEEISIGALREV